MTRKHFAGVASDIGLQLRRIDRDDSLTGAEKEAGFTALWELVDLLHSTFAAANSNFDFDRFQDHIRKVAKDGLV